MEKVSNLSTADWPRQHRTDRGQRREISIIVPVLNEAPLIRGFLQHLRSQAPDAEIIVVDGGSSDGTAELARELADRVSVTEAGRAVQMNAGARAASADILWFLHVDTEVPRECVENIIGALRDKHVVGGFFRIRLPRQALIFRATDTLAHYLGLICRIRCGDHGLFCRRELFFAVDGFPEVALMEDVAFYRALCRHGRMRVIPSRLIVSPRRYENRGPYRVTAAYGLIAFLFMLGVRRAFLLCLYRRFCA